MNVPDVESTLDTGQRAPEVPLHYLLMASAIHTQQQEAAGDGPFSRAGTRTASLEPTVSDKAFGRTDGATGAVDVPFKQGTEATKTAITDAAKANNLDPKTLLAVASIESNMNPNSNANRTTQYKGLFQMGRAEWAKYGEGGNVYSAKDNAYGAAKMLADHRDWFKDRYGKDPTDAQLYMMHQQGRGFYRSGTMTNIAGNPYPGMRGLQSQQSFERGWGAEVSRRKEAFE